MLSKSNTLILLILFILISINLSEANNKVGNGGDVVVCKEGKNGKIVSVQLLDFFENKKVGKAGKGSDEYSLAKTILEKLKIAAPKLEVQYQQRLTEIKTEIEFVKDLELSDIKDSDHLVNPKNHNCTITQVAIRKKEILNTEKRFLFDLELWNKMDNQNRAGLLTHEIIYEHFAKLNETDSLKVRKINSLLYTDTEIVAKDFWETLQSLRLPIYP